MPIDQMTDTFVQEWFDLLSVHASVERLLPFLAADGLIMEFPEQTLHDYAEFRSWYAGVGEAYTKQNHVVERVDSAPSASGTTLGVTVVWTASPTDGGPDVRVRVKQRWELTDSPAGGAPVISGYHVLEMRDL